MEVILAIAILGTSMVALPLDYEHQTLNSESNGQPAPAAGWATRFEWRPGAGLFALDVQWTDRARQMIEAGEYRYISPVFVASKVSGVVLDVLRRSGREVGDPVAVDSQELRLLAD